MDAYVLPDEAASLVVHAKESLWVNLYPNALTNVKKALKTHLDQRIGKFCNKNNGIFLSYTDLKFRAKHFQIFEDYPMCRFPVSVSSTYYRPEPGRMSTGFITRVDHISVTCLIHGMIHVTISLRKSVNFDTWCGVGHQIIFLIRGGEMHYKGVRLQAIVTQECVDQMRIAFPESSRKRTFSSSSADSNATTPLKTVQKKLQKKRKIPEIHYPDDSSSFAEDASETFDFGSPEFTSTQRRDGAVKRADSSHLEGIDESNEDVFGSVLPPSNKKVKIEQDSHDETTIFHHGSSKRNSPTKRRT